LTDFRILGSIEACNGEERLAVGGRRQLALLAFLLLHANRAVSSDVVIDAVWGPSRSGADNRLQMAIARLRRSLDPAGGNGEPRLRTVSGGYLLSIAAGELDADVFVSHVRVGQGALDAGEPARAVELLAEALALWRGPPLAEVCFEDFAQAEIRRLEELRLVALQARIGADLQLGRHTQLIAELGGLLAEQPTRERLAELLMLALYRSGRQAEALTVYQRTRTHLAEELGLEPGPALKALQTAVLSQDPALVLARPGNADKPAGESLGEVGTAGFSLQPAGLPRGESLIGRDRELEDLNGLLADPDVALLTLTGTGGAGKTTLALETARRASVNYVDGVAVAWLALITDAGQAVGEVARATGVELSAGEPATETLIRALRAQQRLLILDNFEHILAAAPAVAQLASGCPNLKILITSRAPLRISLERVYHVSGLAVPDSSDAGSADALRRCAASALFIDRATRAGRTFELTSANSEAVADLCRYLGGLPLALELAAARATVLSPAIILERLRTSAEPLGPARRDAPERHRTMGATIDWTYQLLTPSEQAVFARLSAFVGGFTVEAAEAVCADLDHDIVDDLAVLVDHGLVHRAPASHSPRLAMLEPIRDYARERLSQDAGRDQAVSRHSAHYARFAEAAEAGLPASEQLAWLARLDDEQANLRAVLRRATAQPNLDLALRIAGAVPVYWYARDLQAELREWLAPALERRPGDPAVRARAMLALGAVACQESAWPQATPVLRECLRMCGEQEDWQLMASCEAYLAWSLRNEGEGPESERHIERARILAAEHMGPWDFAVVLLLAAICANSYQQERELSEQALTLLESLGDRILPADIKCNLGYSAASPATSHSRD
jgi:predicted ATPase/DNA-binding SARP family transcriptional activator